MRAVITDNQWIYFESITTDEEDTLWIEFSVSDKNVYIDPNQMGPWDGVYRKYNKAKRRIARPLLGMLIEICEKHDLVLNVVDKRPPWQYALLNPNKIGPDFLPGITLDPHQIVAAQRALVSECGIIDIPTGGGKSEVLCCIAKAISCPTIILADQTVVISQLKQRLELRDVAEEIGMFYAGRRPNDELIVVGSIQSLSPPTKPPDIPQRTAKETDTHFTKRMDQWDKSFKAFQTRRKNAKFLQQYVKKAEMIMVDECVDAESYINLSTGMRTAASIYKYVVNGNDLRILAYGSPHRIISASEKYELPIIIETARGRTLRTSPNHPYAVFTNGWRYDVHASNLTPGDLLLVNNNCNSINLDWSSADNVFWRMVGLFIGDGHFLNSKQIKFGVRKDFDSWKFAIREAIALFGGTYSANVNTRGDLVLRMKSEQIIDRLVGLGFTPGRKMGNINPQFDLPTNEATIACLRGLFDSDGHSSHDHLNFDSSDKKLAQFVQVALSSLGIKSSLFVGNKRNCVNHAVGWRVSISGEDRDRFQDIIGFGFSRKNTIALRSKLLGSRYIDPRPYLNIWKQIIPCVNLANILGCYWTKMQHPGMISLAGLVRWQRAIFHAAIAQISNYAEARLLYGISDSKVALTHGIATMTAWNHRKNGDDSLWQSMVSTICNKLRVPLVDIDLEKYAVEPVRQCISMDKPIRLIDFSIETVQSYEANGLLVHNCDRASSEQYKNLFRHYFRGRRRYGFSGTPMDSEKPVQAIVMQEHLGSPLIKVSRRYLERINRIIPCSYYMLAFGLDGDVRDASAYDIAYDAAMVENEEFHRLITSICNKFKNDATLILVDRVALGEKLEQTIRAAGHLVHFICGKTDKRRRDKALRGFENKEFNVLIGGKIINRGLDLSGGCDNLIIATGGKLESDFIQKVGRALRHNRTGRSRVFDFYFRCNKYLYNHSRARLRAMVNAGYQTTVIFPGGKIDGAQLIKNRFKITKRLWEKQ